ncbi:MAG: ADP-glyceromanno-heptose 6-epimerase [Gammaproteobacteria bacterium]|jgi:ADP-L-glycero-D-manno-heptose 6-epimerase|nr:ADP-glyceromanno-heptose 6-epimerase [Gammaproteobacteria bacterium]
MIVVTGAAGFIGSHLLRTLGERGYRVCAVDNPSELASRLDANTDRIEQQDFIARLNGDGLPRIEAVFHQGACTDTRIDDHAFLQRNNLDYSLRLLDFCQRRRIPMVYASSAAVYGNARNFSESPDNEEPLNAYGEFKRRFDSQVRSHLGNGLRAPLVGLRYFNVYGAGEDHKGAMASMVHQSYQRCLRGEPIRLFGASGGYPAGGQQRDFVHVDDVVRVNLHFLEGRAHSGIYNVGTGHAASFRRMAEVLLAAAGSESGIEFFDMPAHLAPRYQHFTRACLRGLRAAGYRAPLRPVEEGIPGFVAGQRPRVDPQPVARAATAP